MRIQIRIITINNSTSLIHVDNGGVDSGGLGVLDVVVGDVVVGSSGGLGLDVVVDVVVGSSGCIGCSSGELDVLDNVLDGCNRGVMVKGLVCCLL